MATAAVGKSLEIDVLDDDCEGTWIETPPPPPDYRMTSVENISRNTNAKGQGQSFCGVDAALHEGHTFGSDTMKAMGAADEVLAAPLTRFHPSSGHLASTKIHGRSHGKVALEQMHLFMAKGNESGAKTVKIVPTITDTGQDDPLAKGGKSPSECSSSVYSGPALLKSSQRLELLRYLKESGYVSACNVPAEQGETCPGIESYLQAEISERYSKEGNAHNASVTADVAEGSAEEESQSTLPSTMTTEEEPLPSRTSAMTMDEMIELGEKQMSMQQKSVSGIGTRIFCPSADNAGVNEGGQRKPFNGGTSLSPGTQAFLIMESQIVEAQENTDTSESTQCSKTKPFLRKGSRKEPSAIHREQNSKSSTNNANSGLSPSHLKHLEKMQEDHMKQLEQRMRKREEARQEQQRRRKQQASARRDQDKQTEARQEAQCNVKKDVLQPREVTAEEAGQLPCKGSDKVIAQDGNCVAVSPQGSAKTKQMLQARKQEAAPKSTSKKKSLRSPLRPKKKLVRNDENVDNNRSLDEQWQVLKSMKRRQEVALREAERERETARAWAAAEREAVKKWTSEQRALIKKERHRAANTAMASQREKQQQQRQRDAAGALSDIREKEVAEVEGLKATIQKLKLDMDAAKARHRLQEKKLKERIGEQNAKIRQLESQIASCKGGSLPHGKVMTQSSGKEERNGKTKVATSQKGSSSRKKAPRSLGKEVAPSCPVGAKVDDGNISGPENEANQAVDAASPKGAEEPTLRKKSSPQGEIDDSEQGKVCEEKSRQDHKAGRTVEDAFNALTDEPTEQWLERHLAGIQRTNASAMQERNTGNNTSDIGADIPSAIQFSFWKEYDARNYCQSASAPCPERAMQAIATSEKTNTDQPRTISYQSDKARTEQCLPDGSRVVTYRNGTQKRNCADGNTVVTFINGDTKITDPKSGRVTYYYASAKTTHTTYPGGLEMYEFPNGQSEKHHPDGRKEILFPDKTRKLVFPNGSSETDFPDGIRVVEFPDGTKQITRF